jgi:glycosyltransferase involved in cell wall biosynthesis
MPTVLTAIPVYNGAHFFPQTLDCIAAQTRRPDRIVVIDNASTDATPDIVRAYGHLNLEYRRNPTNVGGAGNLNLCLQLADQAEILHLMMADDLVGPTFLQRSVDALSGIPGQALSYVLDDKINQQGRVVQQAHRPTDTTPRRVPPAEFLRRQGNLDSILLPGVLFKTDRRPIPAGFRNFPQVADCVFMAELVHLGFSVVEIPEVLCQYRLNELNATSANRSRIDSFVRDEWRAMELIAGWIPESPLQRRLSHAWLKVRFAARTEVKRQLFAAANPAYAAEIDAVRREISGPLLGAAGLAAVHARDFVRRLRGQPTRLQEFESLQDPGR